MRYGIMISLSVDTEIGAGIDYIEFRIDDGNWATYSEEFCIECTEDDDFTVYFRGLKMYNIR